MAPTGRSLPRWRPPGTRRLRTSRPGRAYSCPRRCAVSSSSTEPRRVTIHDVARSAGVSRQTVSRALNGKDEIERSTKQRVLDAARELGYRPSRFARGLVRQDTTTIGLVIPDLRNPFFTEVAASALEAARARGWHVVVYDTADRPEEELGTLQVIGS